MKTIWTLLLLLAFALPSKAEMPVSDLAPDPFLKEFTVYPNPTSGALTVTFQSVDANKPLELKVFNLIGQEMYRESFAPSATPQQAELDLSKLPKGVFIVEISSGTLTKVKRVTVI